MYKRNIYKVLISRLAESRRFIQVISGPRQTGKTTLAQQAMAAPYLRFKTQYLRWYQPLSQNLLSPWQHKNQYLLKPITHLFCLNPLPLRTFCR